MRDLSIGKYFFVVLFFSMQWLVGGFLGGLLTTESYGPIDCLEDCTRDCEDTGCESYFYGLGECRDVTNPDWTELDDMFDLSETANGFGYFPAARSAYGLCGYEDKNCCRCMKKKTCKDSGCAAQFDGQGNSIHNY